MPRRVQKSLSEVVKTLEPKRKNPILLRDDELLDSNLKVIKVGGENTPLSLSSKELKIEGDLFLDGKLTSHKIETDNKYLELSSSGYIKIEADYLRLDPISSSGTLDIYSASGSAYYLASGSYQYFYTTGGTSQYQFRSTGFNNQILLDPGNRKILINDDDDIGDLFAIQTTDNGATTLSTTDDDGATGHMTLQPDGDLVLDPVSQNVIINATDKLYFDGGTETYISETSGDNLKIYVGGDEVLLMVAGVANAVYAKSAEIVLNSSQKLLFDGSIAGHTYISQSSDDVMDFYVGGDKMLSLDETVDTGVTSLIGTLKIAEQADASADTAGYGQLWVHDTTHCDLMFTDDGGNDREMLSGMILGYTDIGLNETRTSYDLTTSYRVQTDEHGVTFTAPPSGNVEIFTQIGRFYAGTGGLGDLFVGLSDANATSGYNAVASYHEESILDNNGRNAYITPHHVWTITGLTSGTSYTYYVGVKSSSTSGGPKIEYGGTGTGHYASFIMKATALPATIST